MSTALKLLQWECQDKQKDKEGAGRKRKQKFSEREQEVLIEEMVCSHELLFGKKALRVPESRKRRIWLDIQEKVNAVGVTQRTVEELRKRWYDMRQRSKEKVAARLAEANKTGGGTSTATDSTPHEELVESTLLPESVSGVADIDSSDPASTSQAQARTQEDSAGCEESEHLDDQAGHGDSDTEATPVPRRKRTIVPPLPPLEDEPQSTGEEDGQAEPGQRVTQVREQHTPKHRESGAVRRRSRATTSCATDEDATLCAGLEGSMLQIQRLQHKSMRSINRHKSLHYMGEGKMGMAGAIRELCATLNRDQAARHRASQHSNLRLQRYTKVVNPLCTATSQLTRRSVSMQVEMSHCFHDVAKGLAQVTAAAEQLQTEKAGGTASWPQGRVRRHTVGAVSPHQCQIQEGAVGDRVQHLWTQGRAISPQNGLQQSVQEGGEFGTMTHANG